MWFTYSSMAQRADRWEQTHSTVKQNEIDKLYFSEGCMAALIVLVERKTNLFPLITKEMSSLEYSQQIFPLLLELLHIKTYCLLTYSLEPSLVLPLWPASHSLWLYKPWHRICTWYWSWDPKASSWAWSGWSRWRRSGVRFRAFRLLKGKRWWSQIQQLKATNMKRVVNAPSREALCSK